MSPIVGPIVRPIGGAGGANVDPIVRPIGGARGGPVVRSATHHPPGDIYTPPSISGACLRVFGNHLYLGASGSSVYRTDDGEDWDLVYDGNHNPHIVAAAVHGSYLYITDRGDHTVLRTSDGTGWTAVHSLPLEASTHHALVSFNGYVYVSVGTRIFRSASGNPGTWSERANTDDTAIQFAVLANYLYAATPHAVQRTIDGTSWSTVYGPLLPLRHISAIGVMGAYLIVAFRSPPPPYYIAWLAWTDDGVSWPIHSQVGPIWLIDRITVIVATGNSYYFGAGHIGVAPRIYIVTGPDDDPGWPHESPYDWIEDLDFTAVFPGNTWHPYDIVKFKTHTYAGFPGGLDNIVRK